MMNPTFPRILEVLSNAWDTSGGQALRALLWSLHNGRNAVPLWHAITDLDDGCRAEFAALLGERTERRAFLLAELLHASGEWDRVDTVALQWAREDE